VIPRVLSPCVLHIDPSPLSGTSVYEEVSILGFGYSTLINAYESLTEIQGRKGVRLCSARHRARRLVAKS
jgi:hypothetical protein